jgi:acetamidase/formamidase
MSGRSLHLGGIVTHGWDRSVAPVLMAKPGDEIELELMDPSGGQITPDSTLDAIRTFDVSIANPVTGPIYVEGALPGDALEVEIRDIQLGAFGWTQQNPGWGLLPAEEFPEPWLHIWDLTESPAAFCDGVVVPLEPMCGVIGVTPAEPGHHSVVPPRQVGGNMDVKQHRVGTTVLLPVEVEGALLGVGDGHAAQGDGEVCGSAIEAPMTVTIRLGLRRHLRLQAPQFIVQRPLERESAARAGYHATTGVGPDLMEAARGAVREMIGFLATRGLTRQEAYALCSVAADLKISEVVDRPNWVVSAFLPLDVFQS